MPRVLISGGTGLIGSALTAALRADGVIVNHLVRRKEATSPNEVAWTPTSAIVDTAAMEGYDAVVHLGGANLAQGRWTKSRRQILRNSRVDTTRVLVDALARLQKKPSVFICASGVGYYGSRGDEILTEGSGNGSDFLGMTCRAWEAEATRANSNGIRTVIARFGVILAAHGGALPAIVAPFKLGLGARLGSGKQWMSWITLPDVVAILCCAIEVPTWSGAYNVVPATPRRLALGERAYSLLLASQRAEPAKLQAASYRYHQENLEAALHDMLGKR